MRQSSWQLLREPAFRSYFAGSLASNVGTWLQSTAQVMLAYQLTQSVFAVGLVVCAQFAAIPLVSPWAAVVADNFGAKRTLVATQLAAAVIAAAMAGCYAVGMLDEHALVFGALGLGLTYSLTLPLQVSLLPMLVERQDFEAAMAMNSVSYNSGRALAPALSVLIVATAGPGIVFALNALSFIIFAIVLARLAPAAPEGSAGPGAGELNTPVRRARATDGIKIALHHRRILLLLAIVAAVTLADDPVMVLSPALAKSGLHVSNSWIGYFIAALGWGAVMGSVLPKYRGHLNWRGASRRAAWWLVALSVSIVLFAAGISPVLSVVCAVVAGGAALATGVAAQTPIIVRDRKSAASVAALWAIAWAGSKPIASLVDGWLASKVGIFGASCLVVVPALALAGGELLIPAARKQRIKNWAANIHFVKRHSLDPYSA